MLFSTSRPSHRHRSRPSGAIRSRPSRRSQDSKIPTYYLPPEFTYISYIYYTSLHIGKINFLGSGCATYQSNPYNQTSYQSQSYFFSLPKVCVYSRQLFLKLIWSSVLTEKFSFNFNGTVLISIAQEYKYNYNSMLLIMVRKFSPYYR